jgi:FKBP-type peptidyl-prolyl cis-trans isomerase FkpA
MRKLLILLLLAAGCNRGTHNVKLNTDDEKTLYALGMVMGRNLGTFALTPAELAIVERGAEDQVSGAKPLVELQEWGPKINVLAQKRGAKRVEMDKAKAEAEKAKQQPFLDKAAAEEGAVKSDSGLIFKTLKPGTGASPTATDTVKVHYHGTLVDGTVFDSSVQRGQPAEFPLNRVIPCWTEGVQKMKVGEKARLVCPSSIAYGDRGQPPKIPGGAVLIFEVELLEIVKK